MSVGRARLKNILYLLGISEEVSPWDPCEHPV